LKFLKNQRGTVLLEFAVMFPIYIAVLLGIINLALLLNNSIVAQAASRDAANAVAVTGNVSKGIQKGRETIDIGGLGGNATVSVDTPGVGVDRVNGTVNYQTPVVAPGVGFFLGGKPWDNQVTLREQTSYYVEYRNRTHYNRPTATCVSCSCSGGCGN